MMPIALLYLHVHALLSVFLQFPLSSQFVGAPLQQIQMLCSIDYFGRGRYNSVCLETFPLEVTFSQEACVTFPTPTCTNPNLR